MIYNANSDMLCPCVIHSGNVQDAVSRYFSKDMFFCMTQDGELNQNALIDVVQYIERLRFNDMFPS